MFEEVIPKVFHTAEMMGKDIDQFHLIVDLGGFNNRQHLCLARIPQFTGFAQSFHSGCAHFPRNVTLVNSKRNEFVNLTFPNLDLIHSLDSLVLGQLAVGQLAVGQLAVYRLCALLT